MQELHWRRSRGAVYLAGSLSFSAMAQGVSPPNFAPNASNGWYAYNRQFIAPASGAGRCSRTPRHPYVTNDEFRVTGRQPTQQLADLRAPKSCNLGEGYLRKRNELVLPASPLCSRTQVAGRLAFPEFLLRPMTQAMYFVHAPKKVLMILSSKQEVRHILT